MIKIGVLVGSVRRESLSKKVAQALGHMLPEDFEVQMVDIAALPMFNQDYDDDGTPPPEWTALREQIKSLDGFLFVTPEYNRSVPPMLKNAIDIASRPHQKNCWGRKPGAVIGVSPGKMGGFGACMHLRQSLSCLNVSLMNQPETYVGGAAELFDPAGKLVDEGTEAYFRKTASAFAQWVRDFHR